MGEKKKEAQPDKRALYRKYRSKSLGEIVGQEHITKTLENAVKSGKISHAYLFTGPRGVGKTSIARILAHEINELPYTDDSLHLDIIEIDAASNRRIDDIRDLREKVNLAPVNAKYKVYIIDEVHMLTSESFNALLKTLEEPPAHVVFILATTEVHKLPATIISRTQRHTFRAVPVNQVATHLETIAKSESIEIDREALELIARHGEGGLRDSISLLDQVSHLPQPVGKSQIEQLIGIAPADDVRLLLTHAEAGDTKALISHLQHFQELGVSPQTVAAQLLEQLRDQSANPQAVELMKNLLAVSSALQPFLALEITLLEYALAHGDTTQEAPTSPSPASPTVEPKPAEPAPTKTVPEVDQAQQTPATTTALKSVEKVKSADKALETPQATKPKPQAEASAGKLEEFWPDMLAEIKERNGSLYTVMRLAKPKLQGSQLTLAFKFAFHQKRVQDLKNTALISEIVSNHLNIAPEIIVIVDPQVSAGGLASSQPAPEPDPAHASLITSIQDIMGGGEIVNAPNS